MISDSKLFSGASTTFGAEPNSQVSLVDAAFPGMLPVINKLCVEQAVRTGLGLKAEINLKSLFDRKNYFYADLPPAIRSRSTPSRSSARASSARPGRRLKRHVGITRLHLEQDAGKSLHDQHPTKSYIDLNRSGIALMEIVSEPDMRSSEEAAAYLKKLRSILRYLGTCDGNMEEGSMRCDVNVSVRKPGGELGTRCEIKNVNSFRYVQQAIEYEARRQIEIIEDGGKIKQETRLFDPNKGETRSMRSKEHAHDYRYFPDPDLLPLVLDPNWVSEIKATLPELPDEKRARFTRTTASALRRRRAGLRKGDRRLLRVRRQGPRCQAGRQLGDQRSRRVAQQGRQGHHRLPVSAGSLGGLIDLIAEGAISATSPRTCSPRCSRAASRPRTSSRPRACARSPTPARSSRIDDLIAKNPDQVADTAAARISRHRLLRRPGDEGHRRQGQPGAAERAAEGKLAG